MSELRFDRTMSDAEALMWRLEGDPHLSSAVGTVTLQTGDLTSTNFTKSGAGTLLIASPITVDAGAVLALSGGTFQVSSGAALSSGAVTFSGDSTTGIGRCN